MQKKTDTERHRYYSGLTESQAAVSTLSGDLPVGCGVLWGKDNWFLSWSAQPGMRAPCPGEDQQRASTTRRGRERRLIFLPFHGALFVLIMLIIFPTVLLLTDLIASNADRGCADSEQNSNRERDYKPVELWLKLSVPRSLCLLLETLIQVLPGLCVQTAGHKHKRLSQVCQPYQSDLESKK